MDRRFFIAEIETCSDMMYRVAWSILRNDADVQDALQDAALKAWEKRDKLLAKIAIVDECAKEAGGGEWYAALIQNVCIGKSYEQLDKALMPTSFRQEFFAQRRSFFKLLNDRKE